MGKTSQKVTKDPKCVEAACKGRKNYMNKLKESILNDSNKGGRDTSNASNEITSSVNTATPPPCHQHYQQRGTSYFVDLPAQANPPCHGGLPLCHFYEAFHNHQNALVICKLGQAQKVSKMWLSILID